MGQCKQSGFRKNHAKGVAVAGYFDSNGNGREVSSAAVFRSVAGSPAGRRAVGKMGSGRSLRPLSPWRG